MLERLVSFDTTSRNSNLPLLDFVAGYLEGQGVPVRLVHNPERTKANLYATIGPDVPGGVVLSGHTDVVPVDGQAWDSDPWTVTERDGRLYGRGVADMKSFCALALAAVPLFQAAKPPVPVHLALSHDEEVGCIGVRSLIAELADILPKPRLCIVGEPTLMRVVNGHKGIRSFRTFVTGQEAHSSQPHRGVNAVMVAAELIMELEALGQDLVARGDPTGRFDPPYTTVQCSVIEGGTATNILAGHCMFQWDYRFIPGTDEKEGLRRLESYVAQKLHSRLKERGALAAVRTELRSAVPPLAPEPFSPAETLAKQLAGQNHAEAVSYGTEAGLFQEIGISTVVCGPGSIDQAHKPNEWIAVSQLEAGWVFMQRLANEAAKGFPAARL